MAGLVQLGDDWYGLVHSWADCKKKSNLMLSVLPPGDDALPWLGPLSQLGIQDSSELGKQLNCINDIHYSKSAMLLITWNRQKIIHEKCKTVALFVNYPLST